MKKKLFFLMTLLGSILCLIFGLTACNGGDNGNTNGSSTDQSQSGNQTGNGGGNDGGNDGGGGGNGGGGSGGSDYTPSAGLLYELSDDGTYYILAGIGTCTDKNIAIARTHKEPSDNDALPVKSIKKDAFQDNTEITGVTIPDSIESIKECAFGGCRGLKGELVIPDSVTYIDEFAFADCRKLTSITIGNSVAQIGGCAFSECSGITSITIPESVTEIANDAFDECYRLVEICNRSALTIVSEYTQNFYTPQQGGSKLKTVNDFVIYDNETLVDYIGTQTQISIPDGMTAINHGAFYHYGTLTAITVPDSVTRIGEMAFGDCVALENITIPESVTKIDCYAFYKCNGLTGITFEDTEGWRVSQKSDMSDFTEIPASYLSSPAIAMQCLTDSAYFMRSYWEKVAYEPPASSVGLAYELSDDGTYYTVAGIGTCTDTDIVIARTHKESSESEELPVKRIKAAAFRNNSSITSVTLPDTLESIGTYAFYGCNKLVGVDYTGEIAGWCGIEGLDNLMPRRLYFKGVELAGDLVIPDSVTSIGVYAFRNKPNITSVTLPSTLESIGYEAFYGCSGVTSIYYAGDVAAWCGITGLENLMGYGSNDKKLYIDENEIKGDLIIPDSVTCIKRSAFAGCSSITSVTIPSSLQSIEVGAFGGCAGLTSVNYKGDVAGWCGIAGLNALMNNAVSIINKLYINEEEIAGNLVIPDSATVIKSAAFFKYNRLTSVTIGASVTSIESDAFFGCWCLVEIYNKSSLTITAGNSGYGGVAQYALNVYTQEGGGKLTTVNDYIVYDGNTLVAYTGSQTNITIPDSITKINQWAFRDRSELKSVTLGNSVESIGECAFMNCTGLTSMTFGDSVIRIGSNAFSGCSGLTSLTIGASIASIDENAFYNCGNLTSVTFANTNGWSAEHVYYGTVTLSSSALSNSATAATYLQSTYLQYNWKRS